MRLSDSFPPKPDPQGNLRRGRRAETDSGQPPRQEFPRTANGPRPALRLVHEEGRTPAPNAPGSAERLHPARRQEDQAARGERPWRRTDGDRVSPPRPDGYRTPLDVESQARRAVTQSNVESAFDSPLDPHDPRWLVATETAAQLEGSLLTFERRRKVLAFAHRVGVRPFDANLIIAAVQDRARRGEPVHHAMPTVALTARVRRRGSLFSREAFPYVATAAIAVLAHALGIGFVLWLLLG